MNLSYFEPQQFIDITTAKPTKIQTLLLTDVIQ
jgi:hypothetical protein